MTSSCDVGRQALLCLTIFLTSVFLIAGCTSATPYRALASNSDILADARASESVLAALNAEKPSQEDRVLIIGRFTLVENGQELPIAHLLSGFQMAGTWTDHHLGWGDQSAEQSVRANGDGFFAFTESKEWLQHARRWPRLEFSSMSWQWRSDDPYAGPLRKRLDGFVSPASGPYRIVRVRDDLYCIEPNMLYRPVVLVPTVPDLKPVRQMPVAESWGFAGPAASP